MLTELCTSSVLNGNTNLIIIRLFSPERYLKWEDHLHSFVLLVIFLLMLEIIFLAFAQLM